MPLNPEHPEPRRLAPWLFAVGGAAITVGLVAGYFARPLVAKGANHGRADKPMQEPSKPALRSPASDADGVGRLSRATAPPPSPVPVSTAEGLTAKEARDQEVARLAASGPDTRYLTADVLRVGESWARAVKSEGVDLRFDHWTCYRAGCVTDVRHAPGLFERLSRAISTDTAFMGWGAGKMRSGPIEQPDGTIEVTWILYAPEEGKPALVMEPDSEPQAPPTSQPQKTAEMEKR